MPLSRALMAVAAVGLLAIFGCPQEMEEGEPDRQVKAPAEIEAPEITAAVAVLHPTEGHDVEGTVRFEQAAGGIKVTADVTGLSPGKHGFHVHETGDCTAPDASSAGGHFAPDGNPHGAPTDEERHVGDLGNITADENGEAHLEWTDDRLAFAGPHSIIGRAVIVHGGEDDLTSQPSGDAGPRVACGVVGIAETR
ncbi:MAG: superoxide dismutase family protein [Candidatus Eisenbacteria bacterium]|nr:superoxide dismutase family protein [Candidatus Eisenbacteria bacterium]